MVAVWAAIGGAVNVLFVFVVVGVTGGERTGHSTAHRV